MSRLQLRIAPRILGTRLLLGVIITAAAGLIQWLLWPWISPNRFLMFFPANIAAALVGESILAGLASVLASVLLSIYLFHPPILSFKALEMSDWVSAFLFAGIGSTLVLGSVRLQQRSRRLLSERVRADAGQRLEFAARAARVGVWEWEVQTDRMQWDEQMLEFYGIDRGQFTGTVESWRRGLHPEDLKHATDAVEAALKGEAPFDTTFRVIQPGGNERIIQANAIVIRDPGGTPLIMFGLNRDITEEKQNISRLEELNAFFQAAMDQCQVGIAIVDAQSSRIRFANKAAVEMSVSDRGKAPDSLVNRDFRDVWRGADLEGQLIPKEASPLGRSIREGVNLAQEVGYLFQNGAQIRERRMALLHTAPIRDPSGRIIAGIAVFFDTTERHKLLEQLKAAREAAEVAAQVKAKFLDIAAHELRTPVTAFSLLLQLTQCQLDKGQAVTRETLERIRTQAERISRLVVDLLEVSRLERGQLKLQPKATVLRELLEECRTSFEMQAQDRVLSVKGPQEKVELTVDPVRIYEVVSNLIDNAIKYSPRGSPIELQEEVFPDRVRISVRDWGPGITEEKQRSLFQAFERDHSLGGSPQSGLGLGLFICKGIIELHGGTIGVESRPGAGSRFYFDLPRSQKTLSRAA